ncbi:hypothetical protein [Enterococcus casseliflavus]|uniref:hypothetical protein n=1 Tax=Enterococcus casseliflavus TaxID=37734 RepID=UPI002DBE9414|nr:hypothetical protein [Enterococcus casseliflavus]MEB6213377.1 hypothetical protein [Enterococcus casseliflavus]
MILISTVHDPHMKLINDINRSTPIINEIFDEIYICISDETNEMVTDIFTNNYSNVKVIRKQGAADARRNVLKFAISETKLSQQIMYCDFDRVITWIKLYPEELFEVISKFNSNFDKDYIVVGRTEKAFDTHPSSWKYTEIITNKMSALAFGIENLDITAGASIFTLNAGKHIAMLSKHSHTDCEWPKIIYDGSGIIGEIKVDGLSYIEINRANTISEIQEYYERLILSEKITSIFLDI